VTQVVTPGRQHYHPSAAKAWLQFAVSGGTPTINTSCNVASLTDHGTGDFTVNFTTAFSSVNYAAAGMVSRSGPPRGAVMMQSVGTTPTVAAFRIYTADVDVGFGAMDAVYNSVAFFGDQ
jgi:hypothetical protein